MYRGHHAPAESPYEREGIMSTPIVIAHGRSALLKSFLGQS
jgi:hypothetical protein